MIVTCDHCGAKYNLDPTKVQGRGARITCPKCTHVFTVYKEGVSADTAVNTPDVGEAEMDVYSLDFKAVGIRSWKVKVKIGLVYDFSDYRTLEKYIRDGRVSGTDMLSYNGQDWVSINDVGDLKEYFISVYKQCEAAPLNVEPEEKEKKPSRKPSLATNAEEQDELSAAFAAAQAEVTGELPDVNRGNVASRNIRSSMNKSTNTKKTPQRRTDPNLPKERNPLVTIVIGVLVIGGLIFAYSSMNKPPVVVKDEAQPIEQDRSTELREKIRRELEAKARLEQAAALEEQPEEPSNEDEEWTAVIPAEILAQQGGNTPVVAAPSTNKSPGEYAVDGRQKATVGDWNGAIADFQKAVDGDSSKVSYQEGLGEALYRAGQVSQAKSILQGALASGSNIANKWLGYISRDEGDVAGSNQYFQRYLESNPPDSGQIEQVMRGG